ncbi:MAG: hypothetical protein M3R09_09855 [Actinomycetota bacterium]|nr:hypothetical protein [Actinomycetota bacterium]
MAKIWERRRPLSPSGVTAAAGGLGSGVVGGLLASLCCLPLALALGFGGSAFFVSLGAYQTEFRAGGLVITGLATWWVLRRARACGVRRNPVPFLVLSLASFLAASLVLTYVVTPFLYDVYGRR